VRVDVVTRVDWQDRRTMLKVLFPVNVQAGEATYEVPFAAIARSTGNETPTRRPSSRCPPCSGRTCRTGNGVALLNDSKHGYDIKGNRMRLTLLRAPNSPDPKCDRGEHVFTYSLAPHAGDWRNGGVYAEAYDLNNPLTARAVPAGTGERLRLPGRRPQRDALGREEGGGLGRSFLETAGRDGEATLTFGPIRRT
jgi:alpha-mannosidase